MGKQKPRGRAKRLGKKLDYQNIPKEAKLTLPQKHPLQDKNTQVWALNSYANNIKGKLIKVVIIQRIHPQTKKVSQSILFTEDTNLDALKIIQYYSLRFQIESSLRDKFRDAKQFFGLAHFKACPVRD